MNKLFIIPKCHFFVFFFPFCFIVNCSQPPINHFTIYTYILHQHSVDFIDKTLLLFIFFCLSLICLSFPLCPSWPVPHLDEAVPETVGVVGTMETAPLDVHLPMDMPFDHMKNIYVAIATLAAALLIFIVVVSRKGWWACRC